MTAGKYQYLLVALFLSSVLTTKHASAQQGSIYLSAGYSDSWYGKSTIHIEQGNLGNSYNMVDVKGESKSNTPFSYMKLNYRLGYFYNYWQTNGIELSFDPANYAVKDNQWIKIRGTVNNRFNTSKNVLISKANGSYYNIDGANLLSINMVKRVRIYQANTKNIAVDAMGRIGAGPAFPNVSSSLPVNPIEDPTLKFAGWHGGVEAGVRVRIYRYLYVEISGKYDYASFNSLPVYDGSARQELQSYYVIGSVGFTFPTTRFNPLFYREPKIVTILPFYQHKDELFSTVKKRKSKDGSDELSDSLANQPLDSIPEFQEILDRKYRMEHPDTIKPAAVDSLGNVINADSLKMRDSLVVKDSISATANATTDSNQHLSRRELRRKKKQERKAKKHEEQILPDTPQPENKEAIPATEPPQATTAPARGVEEPKAPEVQPPVTNEKQPEVKSEEKKEPELSKKERKRKEKEERRERKRKEKEERAKEKAKTKESTDNAAAPPQDNSADTKPADTGEKKDN